MYSYEDIKLSLYLEIAYTGNVLLLSKSGDPDPDECVKAWEEIIKQSGKATGSLDFDNFNDLEESYVLLFSDYNAVKATLTKLSITADLKYIEDDLKWLRSKGYKFDYKTSAEYAVCIEAAMRRSDDLLTKMVMNRNETKEMYGQPIERPTLGSLIARCSAGIGFQVSKDVLLSEFNEYNKIIQEKNGRAGDEGLHTEGGN